MQSMFGDIKEIDVKVLNKAVNLGVAYAKNNSPQITGWYRKNWKALPIIKDEKGVSKELANNAEYASFVNYGHRLVNPKGETVGYVKSVKGDHLLERTVSYVDKQMGIEFEKEVEAVRQKYEK